MKEEYVVVDFIK